MYRWCILIIVQRDATQSSLFIILQVHCTCFGCQPHPPSGVHKTVTTASGTVQLPPSNVAKLASPRWREIAAQKIWPVPEAVVTVLCTPDGGCGWHPNHVEWTCRIINRLLCVASRWTIINIVCKILVQSWINSVYRIFVILKSNHGLILQIHPITYVFLCLSVESQEHLTFEENPVTLTRTPQFGRKKTKKISLEYLPLKPLLRQLSTRICLHYSASS